MRIGTLGQQNLEGGIRAVWRRQSKVSSQLLMLVAQKPPRRQRAGAGVLLASRSDSISHQIERIWESRLRCPPERNAMLTQIALAMVPAACGARFGAPQFPSATRASTVSSS